MTAPAARPRHRPLEGRARWALVAVGLVAVVLALPTTPGVPGPSATLGGRAPTASAPVLGPSPPSSTPPTTSGSPPVGEVAFVPIGLPDGTPWTLEFGGGTIGATAPNAATVPTSEAADAAPWGATALAVAPGVRYVSEGGNGALAPSGTIDVPFQTDYLVNITTVPDMPGPTTPASPCGGSPFHWDNACPQVNYALSPVPGAQYVPAGQLDRPERDAPVARLLQPELPAVPLGEPHVPLVDRYGGRAA